MKKEKIKEVFSQVEIAQCKMCGRYLSKEEVTQGEGVCFKHWN